MIRIKLTDEDILIIPRDDEKYDILRIIAYEAEQLKKQILDDYEFRENVDIPNHHTGTHFVLKIKEYEELKAKAEKWDKLPQQTEGFMKAFNWLENNQIKKIPENLQKIVKLEQENKRLTNEYAECLKLVVKNKEIVQKVREYRELLGKSVDRHYDEVYLKLKEILGDEK